MLSAVRNFAGVFPLWLALSAVSSAAPVRDPHSLEGATFEQVRAALGEPDVAQAEGEGALWTWRLEACALMIAFRSAAGIPHVTTIMAGPRHRGVTPISPSQCIAAGEAVRHAGLRPSPQVPPK